METKYTDYLKSRGWQEWATYDSEDDDHIIKLECSSVQLFGYGILKGTAIKDLEERCQEYVREIEQVLNLELVP